MSADSPPPYSASISSSAPHSQHTNPVIVAGRVRARDEHDMQDLLQRVQQAYHIFNPEIEPEHETEYYCNCPIHQYMGRKMGRLTVQNLWSKAVMYPGEKAYDNCFQMHLVSNSPYASKVISPYGLNGASLYGLQRPDPHYHARSVHQTIELNVALNAKAQAAVNSLEPSFSIWDDDLFESLMSDIPSADPATNSHSSHAKASKLAGLKKALSIKSAKEKAVEKKKDAMELRDAILNEERGRWPDQDARQVVATYQEKVGMTEKISDLRANQPIQYLHLLRAGYFEPIPVAWAKLNSNPLKFTIDAAAGWRGITPAWRGYEDTAEERLYWVINHRAGAAGSRMKPDIISALNMARARMACVVEPPPAYYSPDDICHLQHTSKGYSSQVMPPPFRVLDEPEASTDDTMILLDVSGSMDFQPMRPIYDQYLITGYAESTQPKNKGEIRTTASRLE